VHLVLSARLQRAFEGVIAGAPDLVIGIQPGPDPESNDRCRAEKDILAAQMQLEPAPTTRKEAEPQPNMASTIV
jgi:hypothetical protein